MRSRNLILEYGRLDHVCYWYAIRCTKPLEFHVRDVSTYTVPIKAAMPLPVDEP